MPTNFNEKKIEIMAQIEELEKNFGEFSKGVSPRNWRSCGTVYSNINDMKETVGGFTEINNEEKKIPWVMEALKNSS